MTSIQATLARARQTGDAAARYSQAQFNQFISAHERFVRREPKGMRAILRFVDASGIDFSRRLMTEADLTGGRLRGARMILANFERANLFCADLTDVDARRADFLRADLRGVALRSARLAGARMDEADLRAAVLARADGKAGFRLVGRAGTAGEDGGVSYAVDFSNCSMKGASLAKSKLRGANFTGANLSGANLGGADLAGAVFGGAIMTGAELSGARIDPGALSDCVRDPAPAAVAAAEALSALISAAERWVVTGGREGRAGVLDDQDLRPLGGVLARRRLTALAANRVCAIGVSFAGSQLQGASFTGADLRDADFTGADLRGASFRGANLWHARFDEADLSPLTLGSGKVRAVDITDAACADDAFDRARGGRAALTSPLLL